MSLDTLHWLGPAIIAVPILLMLAYHQYRIWRDWEGLNGRVERLRKEYHDE
jgi:hypothetical protein